MNNPDCDVLIIGSGHAGCEAALAAARLGVKTVLVTMDKLSAAMMSCNPAVGGIAKSHLVHEIDVMGGEIGFNADSTGIQFRMLNTSNGPAVQSTRVQCDKEMYSRRMLSVIENTKNLSVMEDHVTGIVHDNHVVRGITVSNDITVLARKVILCPGTFLGGITHIGSMSDHGGRLGEKSSMELGNVLRKMDFQMARLKTGTPPRLLADSIDYSKTEPQYGMTPPPFFSFRTHSEETVFHVEHSVDPLRPWVPGSDQMPCYITHTTKKTHDIVRDKLSASSLYGGQITGRGVRYCPSLEDKVVKFPDRCQHHVFLEPEGRRSDLVYPNGISNSLPEGVQIDLVHSIPGLEKSEIVNLAYAIEYDFCDPTQLHHSLETKLYKNLYFAGQINGTTGYEEAAAQGFIAGINAARSCYGQSPIVLGRDEAYIGVLIDDLVTKGTDEPYRMFTSRAEHRLNMRQDNTRFRLVSFAKEIGIVKEDFVRQTMDYEKTVQFEIKRLGQTRSGGRSLSQILCCPGMRYESLECANMELDPIVRSQVEIRIKYAGYLRRQEKQVMEMKQIEQVRIPNDMEYSSIKSLSFESREKLARIRPINLGQASRIPGITPADIGILSIILRSHTRRN